MARDPARSCEAARVTRLWTIGYERLLPEALVAELRAAGVAARARRALSPAVAAPGDVEDAAGRPAGRARHRLRAPARRWARRPTCASSSAPAGSPRPPTAYRRHVEAAAGDELDALAAELPPAPADRAAVPGGRPGRLPPARWSPRRSRAGAPTSRSSTCSAARRPASRRGARTRSSRSTGIAEAAGRLQRDEAVDGAAERARGVDRVVALELPAAQHGEDDVDASAAAARCSASSGAGAATLAA